MLILILRKALMMSLISGRICPFLSTREKDFCPVRLQLSKNLSDLTCAELCTRLELTKSRYLLKKHPLISALFSPYSKKRRTKKHLFFEPQQPQMSPAVMENISMISQIDKGDIFSIISIRINEAVYTVIGRGGG